jgi:hypothetical protein
MNVLLLSSRFVHAAASSILQRRLWSDGIDVWLDCPMDHDSYSEQMLSMMDKSTFIVLLVNKEFLPIQCTERSGKLHGSRVRQSWFCYSMIIRALRSTRP